MYVDNIKVSAKNEKEMESLLQSIWISKQDVEMKFGIEKCAKLIM